MDAHSAAIVAVMFRMRQAVIAAVVVAWCIVIGIIWEVIHIAFGEREVDRD